MALHNIEKRDWRYIFLRRFVNFNHRSYYRSVTVLGKENIPENSPVIYVPNHQNALMDALAILETTKNPPVYLARSDIFKKKIIARILYFLKIMPIYRIRDGYGNLQQNERIMQKVTDVLTKGHPIVMFPEGNHGDKRKLRPLKKGICRFAFQTEEHNNFQLNLKIVPVGLDYSHYSKFHQTLVVNYGKPFTISKYFDAYKKEPPKALNLLKDEIAEKMKEVMLHIDFDAHYHLVDDLRDLYKFRLKYHLGYPSLKQPNKFFQDRKFVDLFERKFQDKEADLNELDQKRKEYQNLLKRHKLRNWLFEKKKYSLLGLIAKGPLYLLGFPVFLYGFLNNLFPYFIPVWMAGKMKDPQFVSSVRSTACLVVFPLLYLLQTLFVGILSGDWWITLGYLISLPFTGLFAFRYYLWIKKYFGKWRYNLLRMNRKRDFGRMHALREQIFSKLDKELFKK